MFAELSPLLADANSGELFRQVLPLALAGAVGVMLLHLGLSLIRRGGPAARSKWSVWDVLIYLAALGCIAGLGVTSFGALLRYGALGGWPLFLHMVAAGGFTAVLPVLVLSWADANRRECPPAGSDLAAPKFYWLGKLMFWLIVAGGLVVTTTMLLSMLPIFGSEDLRTLLDVHRYSGLVVVVAAALHLYSTCVVRLGLR